MEFLHFPVFPTASSLSPGDGVEFYVFGCVALPATTCPTPPALPLPEPGVSASLGAGLMLIAAARSRRRKRPTDQDVEAVRAEICDDRAPSLDTGIGNRGDPQRGWTVTAKYSGEAFRARFGPWAVVAGGSDGIGAAFAEELALRGLHLVLIARSETKLAQTVARIHAVDPRCEVRVLRQDLTDTQLGTKIARATSDLDVGLFVYNAGSGRDMGAFLDHPVENWTRQVQLACTGPLLLSHHFGQRLRARGRGGLVLMSSLASLTGSAYIATYAAAKAFDTRLAEGLWHELAPAGIDVLGCLAGATDTETFREDTGGLPNAMAPIDVAAGTLDFLGKGPLYVPGDMNRKGAKAIWPVPRIPLINTMSEINAKSFGLPFETLGGTEFGEG